MIHIQRWPCILVSFGKDDLTVKDERVDMIDVARQVALQQVEGLQVAQGIQTRPEFFRCIDARNPDGRCLGTRLEQPGGRYTLYELAYPVIVEDRHKIGN